MQLDAHRVVTEAVDRGERELGRAQVGLGLLREDLEQVRRGDGRDLAVLARRARDGHVAEAHERLRDHRGRVVPVNERVAWLFRRRRVAATPRPRRGSSAETRPRRGDVRDRRRYWLVWACPKDAFYKAHEGSIVVQLFFATGAALSAGHAVTSWGADKALNAMHAKPRSAVFTTLMAGAFGASGGGLSVVALDVWDEGADPDRAYGAFLFAAVGSTGYYLLRDPHGVLGLSGLAAPDARLVVGAYERPGWKSSERRRRCGVDAAAATWIVCGDERHRYSLLSSAVPKIYAALGADVSAATPPRLVEASVRFCLRLPARVGTAGKSKDD